MARFAILGSSTIFIFLSILLSISRVAPGGIFFCWILILIAMSISLVISYKINGRKIALISAYSIGIFWIICITWVYATDSLFDPGYDSYSYHIPAIWAFSHGWGPFHTHVANILIDSYPNGHWALQSFLVTVTGKLLAGQSLTIGLMAAVAILAFGFFYEQFSHQIPRHRILISTILSLLIVANPVVLTQILTHYVDAPLYLYGCSLALLILLDGNSPNRFTLWGAGACIVLILNTKTSGLYYAPVIAAGSLISEFILRKVPLHPTSVILWMKSKGLFLGLSILAGVMLIGFKPYVTNVVDYGRIIYPPLNQMMQDQDPPIIQSLPSPLKFMYGILARSESGQPPNKKLALKLPGMVYPSELTALTYDTRSGGFGPFFSLAFFAAILASAGWLLLQRDREGHQVHRKGMATLAFGALLLLASMFFPESWWARYIPFAWLGVVLIVTPAIYVSGQGMTQQLVRALVGISLFSLAGCAIAGELGAGRQIKSMYISTTATIKKMKGYTSVELAYRHSGHTFDRRFSITSASYVWASLLRSDGVNAQAVARLKGCNPAGRLNGHVDWCGR